MKISRLFLASSLAVLLSACGGGGSSPAESAPQNAGTVALVSASVPAATVTAAGTAAAAVADTGSGSVTDTAAAPAALSSPAAPAVVTSTVVASAPTSAVDTTTTAIPAAPAATVNSTTVMAPATAVETTPAGQDASQYTLTFNDDFNSGTSFDATKWATDIYYKANNATKNYDVEGGSLNIWPTIDATGNFFDRTVVSDNKFSQQYGFFEVEAKLPVGAGLHPVISINSNEGPEIALMHAYTGAPNGGWASANLSPIDYVVTAVSTPDHYIDEFRVRNLMAPIDLSTGFHKYGIRWDATTVKYYLDGVQVGHTINHTQIRTPMYFFIGLWMVNEETSATVGSGPLSGANRYTPQGKSNAMKINYARAWKFSGA
jgi:beta-glucanase (GH16 family)